MGLHQLEIVMLISRANDLDDIEFILGVRSASTICRARGFLAEASE